MYDVSENSLIDCEGGKHAMRCDWKEGEKWIDARAPACDLKWNGRKEWNRWVEDDAAAARKLYVYIGAGVVVGLGPGVGIDQAVRRWRSRMFFGGSCRGPWSRGLLLAREDTGGRSSDGIRWPLRQVVT